MITIEDQEKLLIKISEKVEKPVTAYAIGGTAMMFYGLKELTYDIDLVFTTETERKRFQKAIEQMGYQQMSSFEVYGSKSNKPIMYRNETERLDLFLNEIIRFKLSENMQNNASQIHDYGKKLRIMIVNPQDIIILKCATDRLKDLEDAQTIIKNYKVQWGELIEEAENQVLLGKTAAVLELGEFLENLKNSGIDIPDKVLDKLYDRVKYQIKNKGSKKQ